MAIFPNQVEITRVGEAVEKMELSSTAGGNINWYSNYGEYNGASSKN